MRTLLGAALALALSGHSAADDKIDPQLLLGKWEPKEPKDGRRGTLEFLKDGKLVVTRSDGDKESRAEGSYKVDGAKLTVTVTADGKEQTDSRLITKLTDAEFVTTGTNDTKEFTMVRVKEKDKK
jgi:uncharacterized protein (TIGR03066 family)